MFTDHKSSLDDMSHSQIRVVLEHLLMTMDIEQRKLARRHAGGEFRQVAESLGRAVRDAGERLC